VITCRSSFKHPPVRPDFRRTNWTVQLCAYPANRLHSQHSLACSRPDFSPLLQPTGCTGRIHPPFANRITLRISANRMHRQHPPACRQPDHSAHLRQQAIQAFTRLQPTGPNRWSETSSCQLNHGFLPQNSTLLYD